jgi:hypothetical protein
MSVRRARVAAVLVALVGAACSGRVDVVDTSDSQAPAGSGPAPAGASPVEPIDPAQVPQCMPGASSIGRAPLRRLTRAEYNASVRDLLGDDSNPANGFPSEELGNGFGNSADAQSVSSLLAEQYSAVAEAVARRATESPERLARLHACAAPSPADAAAEDACARSLIGEIAARAYRRPLSPPELDELLAFHAAMRAGSDFAGGIAAVLEVVLQSPDFLYRIERGMPDPVRPGLLSLTGPEMATRLSYLFWGTLPDAELMDAAANGSLGSPAGVLNQATRMLEDPRARQVVRFFFDNLLPIGSLASLERDRTLFPSFAPAIGALMHEETQTFLEREIFEDGGSWPSALSAPYTYVNAQLADYYGIPGVTGEMFQKVALDPARRLGLLTQGGMLAGTTHSNTTSPVQRGAYVVRKLMCVDIPLPTAELLGPEVFAMIKPPEPYSGATARERFSKHSADPVCASCHQRMDPVGLALENFDAVGLWRDRENDVAIEPSGEVPGLGKVGSAIELAQKIAGSEETQRCFATHWLDYAFGRTLDMNDACTRATVEMAFASSGYDVRSLLLAITQTDAFLHLPAVRE